MGLVNFSVLLEVWWVWLVQYLVGVGVGRVVCSLVGHIFFIVNVHSFVSVSLVIVKIV